MQNSYMSKYSLITLEEVHSTNSYALENISSFEDKTAIYSPCQTDGRGRYNRKWLGDDSQNVYLSIVLKPESTENYPFWNLTQYLSVILCKLLEKDFGLNPRIKWPNDILVDGAKISGILAESYMEDNKVKGIVLGLGLNVNMPPRTLEKIDQKAVSIFALKNSYNDPEIITRHILDSFFASYDEFISIGFKYIQNDYVSRCGFLEQNITIKESGETKKYFARAIDNDGFLLVNDEFNNECKIITGDLTC